MSTVTAYLSQSLKGPRGRNSSTPSRPSRTFDAKNGSSVTYDRFCLLVLKKSTCLNFRLQAEKPTILQSAKIWQGSRSKMFFMESTTLHSYLWSNICTLNDIGLSFQRTKTCICKFNSSVCLHFIIHLALNLLEWI
jgi:hypothetical protein